MTVLLRAAAIVGTAIVLVGCSSLEEDIKRKCASATDPAACEKAQYEQIRAKDQAMTDLNSNRGGY